jgi:hypothetical protein
MIKCEKFNKYKQIFINFEKSQEFTSQIKTKPKKSLKSSKQHLKNEINNVNDIS